LILFLGLGLCLYPVLGLYLMLAGPPANKFQPFSISDSTYNSLDHINILNMATQTYFRQ
jgi:hypothetical protein